MGGIFRSVNIGLKRVPEENGRGKTEKMWRNDGEVSFTKLETCNLMFNYHWKW
jgi:hypothetical protein